LLDVREEGRHGDGHPLLAVSLPYSRLELDIARLVPRRSCRIVLADDGDGVAARAARRLAGLGYRAVEVLDGGVPAWAAAGHRLFPSSNVPSKAFAELVEIGRHTPHVTAAELDAMRRAGRTRSIIGAQSLIDAGVPNPVVSLQGGTQGWVLSGLELERQTRAAVAPVSAAAAAAARRRAEAVAERFGVRRIDAAALAAWQADPGRTTHLLDVR